MNFQTVQLARGAHSPDEGKGCLMEVVSMLAGEPFSDTPECACPVLSGFARRTNDWMHEEERQLLWPFTTRLVNSRGSKEETRRRAYRMADWACREVAPLALEWAGKAGGASELRGLPPVVDKGTAEVASKMRRAAYAAYANHATYVAGCAAAAAAFIGPYPGYAAAAGAHAADVAHASRFACPVQMRLSLLDELCPPAPLPDDALICGVAEELEKQAA